MITLREGSSGPEVTQLQEALKTNGFDPGNIDGAFGPGTEAALISFQRSEGLVPDGIGGPLTLAALGMAEAPAPGASLIDVTDRVTVGQVSKMCPGAPLGNIKEHLPTVLQSLKKRALGDRRMILMAIATIRAETGRFEPISEYKSKYNTSPNGHPFDLYDNRKNLGNRGKPDGSSYKGRGFVQLTGRANYTKFSGELGLDDRLVLNPELANDPVIAADLLSLFLKSKEKQIRAALDDDDLGQARKLVNGGSHGLHEFMDSYRTGQAIID